MTADDAAHDAAHAAARDALPRHGLPDGTRLRLLHVSENHTFAVQEPDGTRSVLRVHRPGYHDEVGIRSELAWLQAVADDGVVRVPRVLPAASGALVVPGRPATTPGAGEHWTVRFSFLPGVEPGSPGDPTDLAVHLRTLGGIAARLHAHARAWRRPAWFRRLRWDVSTALGRPGDPAGGHWGSWRAGLGVGPAEERLFGRAADLVAARLAAFGDGPDRFGLVHADMRLANLLVDDAGGVAVIDFDDCGLSWFGYDLAATLSFVEDDPRVPDLTAAWVQGYREEAPLDDATVALLPTFVMLRRLLLVAWIGSHPFAQTARELGEGYTAGTVPLAQEFLAAGRSAVDG